MARNNSTRKAPHLRILYMVSTTTELRHVAQPSLLAQTQNVLDEYLAQFNQWSEASPEERPSRSAMSGATIVWLIAMYKQLHRPDLPFPDLEEFVSPAILDRLEALLFCDNEGFYSKNAEETFVDRFAGELWKYDACPAKGLSARPQQSRRCCPYVRSFEQMALQCLSSSTTLFIPDLFSSFTPYFPRTRPRHYIRRQVRSYTWNIIRQMPLHKCDCGYEHLDERAAITHSGYRRPNNINEANVAVWAGRWLAVSGQEAFRESSKMLDSSPSQRNLRGNSNVVDPEAPAEDIVAEAASPCEKESLTTDASHMETNTSQASKRGLQESTEGARKIPRTQPPLSTPFMLSADRIKPLGSQDVAHGVHNPPPPVSQRDCQRNPQHAGESSSDWLERLRNIRAREVDAVPRIGGDQRVQDGADEVVDLVRDREGQQADRDGGDRRYMISEGLGGNLTSPGGHNGADDTTVGPAHCNTTQTIGKGRYDLEEIVVASRPQAPVPTVVRCKRSSGQEKPQRRQCALELRDLYWIGHAPRTTIVDENLTSCAMVEVLHDDLILASDRECFRHLQQFKPNKRNAGLMHLGQPFVGSGVETGANFEALDQSIVVAGELARLAGLTPLYRTLKEFEKEVQGGLIKSIKDNTTFMFYWRSEPDLELVTELFDELKAGLQRRGIKNPRFYPELPEIYASSMKLDDIQVLDAIANVGEQGGESYRPVTCPGTGECCFPSNGRTVLKRTHSSACSDVKLLPTRKDLRKLDCYPKGNGKMMASSTASEIHVESSWPKHLQPHWFHQSYESSLIDHGEWRVLIVTSACNTGNRGRKGEVNAVFHTKCNADLENLRIVSLDRMSRQARLHEDFPAKVSLHALEEFALRTFEQLRAYHTWDTQFESLEVGVRLDIGISTEESGHEFFVNEITREWFGHYFSAKTPAPHTASCVAIANARREYLFPESLRP